MLLSQLSTNISHELQQEISAWIGDFFIEVYMVIKHSSVQILQENTQP